MLVEIESRERERAGRVITEVGEGEFRRGVARMTGYDTRSLTLDDVVCVYVLARQGRVHPPSSGRRAAQLYPNLPSRTPDDPCLDLSRRSADSESPPPISP